MKTLDPKKAENKAEKAAVNGSAEDATVSAPSVQIDLSKVKIEPLFADDVDFETFSKSDFRVVKIEACEAVPKSKKLLKFTLNDGTDRKRTILSGIHEYYEPEELVGKTCVAITNLPLKVGNFITRFPTLKEIILGYLLGIGLPILNSFWL